MLVGASWSMQLEDSIPWTARRLPAPPTMPELANRRRALSKRLPAEAVKGSLLAIAECLEAEGDCEAAHSTAIETSPGSASQAPGVAAALPVARAIAAHDSASAVTASARGMGRTAVARP